MNVAPINIQVVGVSALLEAARKTDFKGNLSEIAAGFTSERYIFYLHLLFSNLLDLLNLNLQKLK